MREPIVKNEAKGVAPLILAYIEILLREKGRHTGVDFMLKEERQALILNKLHTSGKVVVSQLGSRP